MELETLRDLYVHELKDLYSAEKQLVKALPKMAKAATNEELKAGIEAHLEETVEHVNRLETLLEALGESTRGPKCAAMEGLIEEGSHLIEEDPAEEVLDAGLICGGQKIEHYEIAGYGTVRTWAEILGETDAVRVLQTTLDEEIATDRKLTELAMSTINVAAANNEGSENEGKKETTGRGRYVKNGGKSRTGTAAIAEKEEDSGEEDEEEEATAAKGAKSSGRKATAGSRG